METLFNLLVSALGVDGETNYKDFQTIWFEDYQSMTDEIEVMVKFFTEIFGLENTKDVLEEVRYTDYSANILFVANNPTILENILMGAESSAGAPGSMIGGLTINYYEGDAVEVHDDQFILHLEGAVINLNEMITTAEASLVNIAKEFEISIEAVITHYNNPEDWVQYRHIITPTSHTHTYHYPDGEEFTLDWSLI